MIEFGKTLRSAREAKGYTASQIAEMTHIKSSVIDGLENEDFSMIAAPIYGRGFVKLYCEAVGLEAKPLVDEYMAIINGNREIAIRERPVVTAKEEASVEPQVTPEPVRKPEPEQEPEQEPEPEQDLFVTAAEPPKPANHLSRYAPPTPVDEDRGPDFPAVPWRLILLGVAGLALLVLIVFGLRALYAATTSDAPTASEAAMPVAATEPVPATPPAVRTQQQSIPSLYID